MMRKVDARAAAADMQSGMAEAVLMDKYGVSHEELASLSQTLDVAGLLAPRPRHGPEPLGKGEESETAVQPQLAPDTSGSEAPQPPVAAGPRVKQDRPVRRNRLSYSSLMNLVLLVLSSVAILVAVLIHMDRAEISEELVRTNQQLDQTLAENEQLRALNASALGKAQELQKWRRKADDLSKHVEKLQIETKAKDDRISGLRNAAEQRDVEIKSADALISRLRTSLDQQVKGLAQQYRDVGAQDSFIARLEDLNLTLGKRLGPMQQNRALMEQYAWTTERLGDSNYALAKRIQVMKSQAQEAVRLNKESTDGQMLGNQIKRNRLRR